MNFQGLVGCQRRELRKLNTIITSMADEGLVEKILVPYEGLNGLSRVHCIKLPDQVNLDATEQNPVASTGASPVLLVTLTFLRQMK